MKANEAGAKPFCRTTETRLPCLALHQGFQIKEGCADFATALFCQPLPGLVKIDHKPLGTIAITASAIAFNIIVTVDFDVSIVFDALEGNRIPIFKGA